jgi:hypothetical protein
MVSPFETLYRQRSLRTGYLSSQTRIDPGGHIQSTSQGFENGFGAVVVVNSGQQASVQIQSTLEGYALQKMWNERGTHLADAFGAKFTVKFKVATTTKVYCHQSQGFVHGHDGVTHAVDALTIAQGLGQGSAQDNAHVFHGMVFVDVQISFGAHGQIKAGVAGQSLEHVVQKANAGVEVGLTGAI